MALTTDTNDWVGEAYILNTTTGAHTVVNGTGETETSVGSAGAAEVVVDYDFSGVAAGLLPNYVTFILYNNSSPKQVANLQTWQVNASGILINQDYEVAAGAPPEETTDSEMIAYIYAFLRNKRFIPTGGASISLYADDGTTEVMTQAITRDGTGTTFGEWAAP